MMEYNNSIIFHHPSNIFVAGPSGSGKTVTVGKIVKYRKELFDKPIGNVYWCYKEWQFQYENVKKEDTEDLITFIEGIPSDDDSYFPTSPENPYMIIFDDMMGTEYEDKIVSWFTRKGHHRGATCIYITQNLYQQSKNSRNINLNSKYMLLFKNSRDKGQIKVLSGQSQIKHLVEAYNNATEPPYGYLLLDFHPMTNDKYRLKTDIFPHSDGTGSRIYV